MDLQRLEEYVLRRKEDPKVDLKWEQCLDSKERCIEFAIDIAAIANSKSVDDDSNGYLILGVPDISARRVPPRKAGCAPFGNRDEMRIFNQRIQQIIDRYCAPSVDVEYREYHIEDILIGLVTVSPPSVLPVFIHNTGRDEADWVVWVRSGKGHPRKRHAKGDEIQQFFLDYLRVLNPYMTDEDWKRYEARVKRLTRADLADRIAFLATELVQPHVDQRALACRALGEITGLNDQAKQLAGQLLIGALYDEDSFVQGEAVRALGQMKDDRAIESLHALYRKATKELPFEIISVIRAIGGNTAIEAIRSIRDQTLDNEIREHANRELAQLTS